MPQIFSDQYNILFYIIYIYMVYFIKSAWMIKLMQSTANMIRQMSKVTFTFSKRNN